jgi:hypothetical protein
MYKLNVPLYDSIGYLKSSWLNFSSVCTVNSPEKGGRTVDVAGLIVTAQYKSMWDSETLLGLEANGWELCDVRLYNLKGGLCALCFVVYLYNGGFAAIGNYIFKNLDLDNTSFHKSSGFRCKLLNQPHRFINILNWLS